MAVSYNLQELVEIDIISPLPEAAVAEIISQAPFVAVPGLFNLRDISSASTAFSTFPAVVRPGLAYRSGAPPSTLPDGGKYALTRLGIKKIFDLRRPDERANKPSPKIKGVDVVWIPDANAGKAPALATEPKPEGDNSMDRLIEVYLGYLQSHAPVYKAVFEHIRDEPDKPFLFHCSAGKDRTGVLAALIHRLAGSSDEAIIYDFTLTRVGIEPGRQPLLRMMQKAYGEFDWESRVLPIVWGVHAAGMTGFLRVLDESHGGVMGYLNQLGISDSDIQIMRANLVMSKELSSFL
ncbi:protein-tyrosine phosphatase-like protein [Aspergillus californicus]